MPKRMRAMLKVGTGPMGEYTIEAEELHIGAKIQIIENGRSTSAIIDGHNAGMNLWYCFLN